MLQRTLKLKQTNLLNQKTCCAMAKTHYRKAYKSDHLGVSDLEDFIEQEIALIFTIKQVKQGNTKVAGKSGFYNVAYFSDKGVKPLVLNATNAKRIASIAGSPLIEDWKGIKIELYIDSKVKMLGEVVGGVRVKSKPTNEPTKQELEERIKSATSISQLTPIKSFLSKHGLVEAATNKFNELNKPTDESKSEPS